MIWTFLGGCCFIFNFFVRHTLDPLEMVGDGKTFKQGVIQLQF